MDAVFYLGLKEHRVHLCLMTLLPSLDPVQVSQELLQQIRETVLQKTVDGMREEGAPYVGKCSVVCPPPHLFLCL